MVSIPGLPFSCHLVTCQSETLKRESLPGNLPVADRAGGIYRQPLPGMGEMHCRIAFIAVRAQFGNLVAYPAYLQIWRGLAESFVRTDVGLAAQIFLRRPALRKQRLVRIGVSHVFV